MQNPPLEQLERQRSSERRQPFVALGSKPGSVETTLGAAVFVGFTSVLPWESLADGVALLLALAALTSCVLSTLRWRQGTADIRSGEDTPEP